MRLTRQKNNANMPRQANVILVESTSSSSPPPPAHLPRRPQPPATIDSLPHDVLASIFSLVRDPHWIRETVPLVCRDWRDVYYGERTVALRETLAVDPAAHSGKSVVLWASRNATAVQALVVEGGGGGGGGGAGGRGATLRENFTVEHLATIVTTLACRRLAEIRVGGRGAVGEQLLSPAFWSSLWSAVVPGRLRVLVVKEIGVPLSERDVEPVGLVKSLETLTLSGDEQLFRRALPPSLGLRPFPAQILALTRLRRLELSRHRNLTELPAGISSLRNLLSLSVRGCSLRSLPAELGSLSSLTSLDLSGNISLGLAAVGEEEDGGVFPAALLGMTSLRVLDLGHCELEYVPAVVGAFQSLETLVLRGCLLDWDESPIFFPVGFPVMPKLTSVDLSKCGFFDVPEAVLSSMPALTFLDISENELSSLPEGFGRSFRKLVRLNLEANGTEESGLRAVPRELAGATSLEEVNLNQSYYLQVDEPLDFLLEGCPRLKLLKLSKDPREYSSNGGHAWTCNSAGHLVDFAVKLRARDPTARVELLPEAPPAAGATAAAAAAAAAAVAATTFAAAVAAATAATAAAATGAA